MLDDVQSRAFAVIVDIRFIGDAENEHLGAVHRGLIAVEDLHGAVDDILRHAGVDFAGGLDQAGVIVELAGLPGKVKRVERNAVAAESRSRIKRLKAVRLCFGRVDHVPDIDAHTVADDRHFVREADIDIAVGVFKELFHFGNGRGGNLVYAALQHIAVQRGGNLRAVFSDAADDLRGIFRLILLVARVHALRREGKVKILAAFEAACLKDRL